MDDYRQRPSVLTDKELLDTFPEAIEILPSLLARWELRCNSVIRQIRTKLQLIDHEIDDEFSRWFWKRWVMLTDGRLLSASSKQVARIKRLIRLAQGNSSKSPLTDEAIQAARLVPIEDVVNVQLRKSGKTLKGLCPFHEERTPSFYIYPDENRYQCYGCNQGGDVIDYIMRTHEMDFKQAVLLLAGGRL